VLPASDSAPTIWDAGVEVDVGRGVAVAASVGVEVGIDVASTVGARAARFSGASGVSVTVGVRARAVRVGVAVGVLVGSAVRVGANRVGVKVVVASAVAVALGAGVSVGSTRANLVGPSTRAATRVGTAGADGDSGFANGPSTFASSTTAMSPTPVVTIPSKN
jgi:hypothetical protein